MNRKRKIKFDGRSFEFLEPMKDGDIEKINNAITQLKESNSKEVMVSLNLSELTTIRRYMVTERVSVELCRDNIIEGMEYRDSKIK